MAELSDFSEHEFSDAPDTPSEDESSYRDFSIDEDGQATTLAGFSVVEDGCFQNKEKLEGDFDAERFSDNSNFRPINHRCQFPEAQNDEASKQMYHDAVRRKASKPPRLENPRFDCPQNNTSTFLTCFYSSILQQHEQQTDGDENSDVPQLARALSFSHNPSFRETLIEEEDGDADDEEDQDDDQDVDDDANFKHIRDGDVFKYQLRHQTTNYYLRIFDQRGSGNSSIVYEGERFESDPHYNMCNLIMEKQQFPIRRRRRAIKIRKKGHHHYDLEDDDMERRVYEVINIYRATVAETEKKTKATLRSFLRYYGSSTEIPRNNIVLQYVSMSLRQLLDVRKSKPNPSLRLKTIKDFSSQILNALEFLNENAGIVHADLIPENVLVYSGSHKGGSSLQFVLTDFEASIKCASSSAEMDFPILRFPKQFNSTSLPYLAPELLLCSETLYFPADCWSLACIAFEMCMGRPLFNETTPDRLLRQQFKFLDTIFDRSDEKNITSESISKARDLKLKELILNIQKNPDQPDLFEDISVPEFSRQVIFASINNLRRGDSSKSTSNTQNEDFFLFLTQLLIGAAHKRPWPKRALGVPFIPNPKQKKSKPKPKPAPPSSYGTRSDARPVSGSETNSTVGSDVDAVSLQSVETEESYSFRQGQHQSHHYQNPQHPPQQAYYNHQQPRYVPGAVVMHQYLVLLAQPQPQVIMQTPVYSGMHPGMQPMYGGPPGPPHMRQGPPLPPPHMRQGPPLPPPHMRGHYHQQGYYSTS